MNYRFYPDEYSETVMYPDKNMPVKSWVASDRDFPAMSDVNHWHNDMEFLYASKGRIYYNIDGEVIELKQGQLLFVNSGHMHFGFQSEKQECSIICLMFHPSLIVSKATEKHLDFLCGTGAPSHAEFSAETVSGKIIIDLIISIHKQILSGKSDMEFELMGNIYSLCNKLMEHFKNIKIKDRASEHQLEAMHKMTGFIQKNYCCKINIDDIAAAGLVCRSRCCDIFKRYLRKTPNEYLTEYRISKGIDLLRNSRMNITDISYTCGFNSSSYFSETFLKYMNCTPREYRRKFL